MKTLVQSKTTIAHLKEYFSQTSYIFDCDIYLQQTPYSSDNHFLTKGKMRVITGMRLFTSTATSKPTQLLMTSFTSAHTEVYFRHKV